MVRTRLAGLVLPLLALPAAAPAAPTDPRVPVYGFSTDGETCRTFHGPLWALETYLSWKSGEACVVRIDRPSDPRFRIECGSGRKANVLAGDGECHPGTPRVPGDGTARADFVACYGGARSILTSPGDVDEAVTYCTCQAEVIRERHGVVPGDIWSKLDSATNAQIDERCGRNESHFGVAAIDADWLPIEAEALGFRAKMPGKARELARDLPMPDGRTARLRLFTVDSGPRLVTASATRLPPGELARVTPDRVLDGARDRLLAGMSATLVREDDLRQPVPGPGERFLPARDVAFAGQHAIRGRARFVAAPEDDTIYGLMVLVDGGSPDDDFERLIASFSL